MQVWYILYSLFQHSAGVQKPSLMHAHCAAKSLVKKKNFKPLLQNGSMPTLNHAK